MHPWDQTPIEASDRMTNKVVIEDRKQIVDRNPTGRDDEDKA